MHKPFELPAPTDAALAHSRRVAAFIAEEIRAAGGWIDFAQFMDLCLYAPGLGYYSAGSAKFGPSGDFVTAPEISPLFARCLARACLPYLSGAADRVIVEVGAGTGRLAADLLDALAALGLRRVRYLVLEVSADLRERQRATLQQRSAQVLERVQWLDTLPADPVDGIFIANEVADALPVSRFSVGADGVLAQGVMATGEGFGWAAQPAPAALARAVGAIEAGLDARLARGYCSEVSLRLPPWIAALGAALREGILLVCDYGMSRREYYHPQRSAGTLTCHYRHRAHADPFLYPGLQDITAWVDFTALAEAGVACGLAIAGYATQAHFLMDAGLQAELAAASDARGAPDLRLVQQAKTLLLPGEMGERFKVMALARGAGAMPGFGIRDLRHLL